MWTAAPNGIIVLTRGRRSATKGRPSTKKFIRIGVDLAKNYFQVHALASEDDEPRMRKLSRQWMRKFFPGIEHCFVGMTACASSHYWARGLKAMGHDVRLTPPVYVKLYVKRGPRVTLPCRGDVRGTVAPRPCASFPSRAPRTKRRRCCTRLANSWSSSAR